MARLGWFVIAAGLFLRLWNFAGGRSLWHDEAMVSLSLIELPFAALLGQLEFDQMAPAGWLLLQKLIYLAWPDIDHGLRISSLLAGVAALCLFAPLARRALPRGEALLALAMFGFDTAAIRYSAMVKPYMFDALLAIVTLWLGMRLLDEDRDRVARTYSLGAIGLCAIPFAFGGTFAMASTGLLLLAAAIKGRDWRWCRALILVGLGWATMFAALYLLVYARQTTTVSNMTGLYWGGAFAPAPTSLQALSWYIWRPFSVLSFLADGLPPLLVTAGVGIGLFGFARHAPWRAALLLGPILVALVASAAHAYPFESRFQLCLAIPILLLLAHGAGMVAGWMRRWSILALSLLAGVLVLPLASASAADAVRSPPWSWEEVEPNLLLLAASRRDEDLVLVSPAAERPLLLYAGKLGLRGLSYRVAAELIDDPRCAWREIADLPDHGRLWLLTYHLRGSEDAGRELMLAGLAAHGAVELVGDQPGAKLYRIDLAPAPPASAAPEHCYRPRKGASFLAGIAARHGMIAAERLAP